MHQNSGYTALTWQQLLQRAKDTRRPAFDNTTHCRSKPALPVESQNHAPTGLQAPTSSGVTTTRNPEAGEEQPTNTGKQQSELSSPVDVTCNQPSNELVVRRGHTLNDAHTDQAILDRQFENLSKNSPVTLRAIGERPVESLSSMLHPSGYTLRSRVSRGAVSTSTGSSPKPSPHAPKTAYQLAKAAEARARRKARRREAKAAKAKPPRIAFETYPRKPPSLVSELPESIAFSGSNSAKAAPNQAPKYDPALPLRFAQNRPRAPEKLASTLLLGTDKKGAIVDLQDADRDFLTRFGSFIRQHGVKPTVEPTGIVPHLEPGTPLILIADLPKPIQFLECRDSVPEQIVTVSESQIGGKISSKLIVSTPVNEHNSQKRKASEEPQDAPLSKGQRNRQTNRTKKSETEAANQLLEAVASAALAPTTKAQSTCSNIRVAHILANTLPTLPKPALIAQAEAINWNLLAKEDRKRLQAVGFIRPRKDMRSPKLPEEKKSPKVADEKRSSKPIGKVKTILKGYQRQREARREVEDFIEETLAETREEYIKVEGRDGEAKYVLWKEVEKMDAGWTWKL